LERRKPNADIANALSLNRIALEAEVAAQSDDVWRKVFDQLL